MRARRHLRPPGVAAAVGAALLFGISTPLSKRLVGAVDPVVLAGVLYLGSGVGLFAWWRVGRRAGRAGEAPLGAADLPWLAGSIAAGGVAGPALLMVGLRSTPASTASLLLNLEGVFTALLAWFAFGEHFDRRLVAGMAVITMGCLVLSWTGGTLRAPPLGALWIAAACLAWALDNNFVRHVSAGDPLQIAAAKGLIAGAVNVSIGVGLGASLPAVPVALTAALVGLLGYGLSLVCFVLALRRLGAARTSAYFSLAPFVGAAASVLVLGDRLSVRLAVGAALAAAGVWLHLTERHGHEHRHGPIAHEHRHEHESHHRHEHGEPRRENTPHSHRHEHAELLHSHPHYPDFHHRHGH